MQFCSLTFVVSRERSESAPRVGWAVIGGVENGKESNPYVG